ncbi:MAG TPA: hypothetical protein VKR83_17210 [Ktedonobacteraceae bacterium]|nr:hypothetical protein [Ktedonobacteraceae bacterium]
MFIPDLKAFDLTAPGIDLTAPFAPDPLTGDLLQFDRPGGLQQFEASDVPMMPDPALPDWQHPTLDQQVEMPDRPGDLASAALTMMHDMPTYKQLPTDNEKALWMAQQGNNQARERHLGMLMLGLDREEG